MRIHIPNSRSVAEKVILLTACLLLPLNLVHAADPIMQPNDRIVILGNTLVERAQKSGYWETSLLTAFPQHNLSIRNLGWDGDTVWADSRGIFDPPQAGYQRMLELVKELKPTVIVLAYGGVEAFPDETRRDQFPKQYRKLLTDLSATNARFVHLSPMHLEVKSFPVNTPEAKEHIASYNQNSTALAAMIQQIAAETGGTFIDLQACQGQNAYRMWTTNGLHLTPEAYAISGKCLVQGLGGDADTVEQHPQFEKIRSLVIEKNRLFFHRWRPQNITYLTGFRKHEQGNNAVEIAQFDPLVADVEDQIQALLKQ